MALQTIKITWETPSDTSGLVPGVVRSTLQREEWQLALLLGMREARGAASLMLSGAEFGNLANRRGGVEMIFDDARISALKTAAKTRRWLANLFPKMQFNVSIGFPSGSAPLSDEVHNARHSPARAA